jgi:hypothetical protein
MRSVSRLHLFFSLCVAVGSLLVAVASVSGQENATQEIGTPATITDSPEISESAIRFFESEIRPLLAEHCYECHNDNKQENDLRLDTFAGITQGGAAGPVFVAGKPEQSLLITAIGYDDTSLQMPPDGKLPSHEIGLLSKWIEMGAPHPDASSTIVQVQQAIDIEAGRQFWSFQPLQKPTLPKIFDSSWPQSPIDLFVIDRLQRTGIQPNPLADKRTLIRRATFDLTGLPPTIEEVQNFLNDVSPDAFARVVDRLLASPAYGIRWGRHWLDVARYADSNGLDENLHYGNAWRYRDYVIDAWNADQPFDEFVLEQLAGDLLETADQSTRNRHLIATGFLSLGPKVLAESDLQKMELDIIDEQVDSLSRSLMGLTIGCARCHDHKFDPIRSYDYYALAGIFKSTRTMQEFKRIAPWWEHPIPNAEEASAIANHAIREQRMQRELDTLITCSLNSTNDESSLPNDVVQQLAFLRAELKTLQESKPQVATAMGVQESDAIQDLPIHIRGSYLTLGETAHRGFPEVLLTSTANANSTGTGNATADSKLAKIAPQSSGRLELARWLTSDQHPLTSRVIVNRIWRWHFGTGIVATTDNFGRMGELPVNQALLDWLGCFLQEHDWSIKELHREILLSSTYQQSSVANLNSLALDPENRLQWRFSPRRLEAEALRDAMLKIGAIDDDQMGGTLVTIPNREFFFNHTSMDATRYDSHRRSVYLPVVRNHLYDMFSLFDFNDAGSVVGDRSTSTVAPQALFLLNSDLTQAAAEGLSRRVCQTATADHDRISLIYQAVFSRPASEHEIARGIAFLERASQMQQEPNASAAEQETDAWTLFCQTVFASNEFAYLK